MFEQSLLQIDPRESTRRWATAVASIALQAGMLAVVLLGPLLAPQVLPNLLQAPSMPVIFNLQQPPDAVRTSGGSSNPANSAILVDNVREFTAPMSIPKHTASSDDDAPGPYLFDLHHGPGTLPNVLSNAGVKLPDRPHGPLVVSRLDEGLLLRRVDPIYPAIARVNRILGQVTLDALISKEGSVENLHAVSGPPTLTQAALDAVRQWRYRPYLLNGNPVEVETHVTVIFKID